MPTKSFLQHRALQRGRWVVLAAALVASGCQFGKYTAELKTGHLLPRLQLHKLPPQWEPPVESGPAADASAETADTSMASGATRTDR